MKQESFHRKEVYAMEETKDPFDTQPGEKKSTGEAPLKDIDKGQPGNKESEKQGGEDEYEKICCLCKRTESRVSKMINLPNNLHICADCMQKTFDSVTNESFPYTKLGNIPGLHMMRFSDMPMDTPRKQRIKRKARRRGKVSRRRNLTFARYPRPTSLKRDWTTISSGRSTPRR